MVTRQQLWGTMVLLSEKEVFAHDEAHYNGLKAGKLKEEVKQATKGQM